MQVQSVTTWSVCSAPVLFCYLDCAVACRQKVVLKTHNWSKYLWKFSFLFIHGILNIDLGYPLLLWPASMVPVSSELTSEAVDISGIIWWAFLYGRSSFPRPHTTTQTQEETLTLICVLSGSWTHYPSVRAVEDSTDLRQHSHRVPSCIKCVTIGRTLMGMLIPHTRSLTNYLHSIRLLFEEHSWYALENH
jgi:hypothetical protein